MLRRDMHTGPARHGGPGAHVRSTIQHPRRRGVHPADRRRRRV